MIRWTRLGSRVRFLTTNPARAGTWAYMHNRSLVGHYRGPIAPAAQCNLLKVMLDMLPRP